MEGWVIYDLCRVFHALVKVREIHGLICAIGKGKWAYKDIFDNQDILAFYL